MAEIIENLNIRTIGFGTLEYEKSLELRDLVLRKPLGMSIYNDNLESDAKDILVGAFLQNELVGTLILSKINSEVLKMRQVAVNQTLKEIGIGRRLVLFSEQLAISLKIHTIELNARKPVIPFYQKLGYEIIGTEFIEVGIPHFKMIKTLKGQTT
jgi:predicted GNAT family N-acyltransferase